MTHWILILFYLFAAHAFFDFAGQGDFMAKGKNHKQPIPGVPWYQCLFAHSLIQGAAVAFILHSPALGISEFAIHFGTDYAKSDGRITFSQDQAIHYGCKVLWWAVAIVLVRVGR